MIQSNEKYRWNAKTFVKCLGYFYEAEEVLSKRHDDNSQEIKHREVCFLLDRLSDRFRFVVDVNDIQPSGTEWPPSVLLNSIISIASTRFIPVLREEKY